MYPTPSDGKAAPKTTASMTTAQHIGGRLLISHRSVQNLVQNTAYKVQLHHRGLACWLADGLGSSI
jgi:hypothetical protein